MSYSRDWNDGLITNQTLFGGAGQAHSVVSGRCRVSSNANNSVTSRLNDAPSTANFEATFLATYRTSRSTAFTYRTSYWDNGDGTHAYLAHIGTNTIDLYRGTNSVTASWTLIKSYSITLTAGTDYNIKVRAIGNYHEIWLNGMQLISVYDATHPNAGQFGFRVSGSVTDYSEYDNLVITDLAATDTNRGTLGRSNAPLVGKTTLQTPPILGTVNTSIHKTYNLYAAPNFNVKNGGVAGRHFTPIWSNYLSNPIYVDATGYIAGVVKLEGVVQKNTLVKLYYEPNGKYVSETITDANGLFIFRGLEVGQPYYTVLAYKNNYNVLSKANIRPKKY